MHRFVVSSVSALVGSVASRCESAHSPTIHDELFDVHIPKKIAVDTGRTGTRQDLFATAHRCMNNWCFLKQARAYVLGIFVDSAALNRLRSHGDVSRQDVFRTDCPKSFILYFASTKDSKHIRKGFARSFENFIRTRDSLDMSLMARFLTVMQDRPRLTRGDFIRVSCIPATETVIVAFNDETVVRIEKAQGLIDWVHSLYVGVGENLTARYAEMQEKLKLAHPPVV